MASYKVQNRITGETIAVEAESAQEACEQLGWMIGNCYVEKLLSANERQRQRDNAGPPDQPRRRMGMYR